jgi:hypothetical protein
MAKEPPYRPATSFRRRTSRAQAAPNPIEDKGHAKAAIIDSEQAVEAGTLSGATREHIVAKARRKLKK